MEELGSFLALCRRALSDSGFLLKNRKSFFFVRPHA